MPTAKRVQDRVNKAAGTHASQYARSPDTGQAAKRGSVQQTRQPSERLQTPWTAPKTIEALAAQVAPRLAAVREELGLNQTQMAAYLGVRRTRYSHWETGRHLPRDDLAILRLVEMTDITLDWLYRGSQAGMPSGLAFRLESRLVGAPPPR